MLYQMQQNDARTFLLYIDSYENGVPTGRFYHYTREERGTFQSLTQLLLKLEQSMDEENMPQSFQKVRVFAPVAGYWEHSSVSTRMGGKATFAVQILFRRNASWQGTLLWLNEKKTKPFRSVLEMISLLHSALGGEQGSLWEEWGQEEMAE